MIDIKRISSIIDELLKKFGKKVVLIPQSDLAVRATSDFKAHNKKIIIRFRPELCTTMDLAYELLQAIRLNELNLSKVMIEPMDPLDNECKFLCNMLLAFVNRIWVEHEMIDRGIELDEKRRLDLEELMEFINEKRQPYDYIEDPKIRLICSALKYSLFELTKNETNYGVLGDLIEDFYNEFDTKALNLGIDVARIIIKNRCLTNEEVRNTLLELIQLFGLKDKIKMI
ncbi:MAG: hypothetical protein QW589_02715 [Candidatus Bathyarchaeia archaeon]